MSRHRKYAPMAKNLEDRTYMENELVKMYKLTRKPKPVFFKDPNNNPEGKIDRYLPQKSEYGSNFYMVSVAAFIKFKSGEWYKYFLGTNCKIDIDIPTDTGGTERVTVMPVVEQVIKQGEHPEAVQLSKIQQLPVLVDAYDDKYESILKEEFTKVETVTP